MKVFALLNLKLNQLSKDDQSHSVIFKIYACKYIFYFMNWFHKNRQSTLQLNTKSFEENLMMVNC